MAKSFKFFESYLEATRTLSVKDRGDFLFAIAQYGINGEEVPLKKSLQPLWLLVKPNLDKSRKYQESGEKGGRPKKLRRYLLYDRRCGRRAYLLEESTGNGQ